MWKINEPCLSYYAVKFNSPKAQKLYLMLHIEADDLRIWLNKKGLFQSYIGDFGRYARFGNWFVLSGDLKKGDNTLLMLVTSNRTERTKFSVKYRADGVSVKVPVK